MRASVSASGDTESSLLRVLLPGTCGRSVRLTLGLLSNVSIWSEGVLFIEACLLRVMGLATGDCLTLRGWVLAETFVFLPPRRGPEDDMVTFSATTSAGEAVLLAEVCWFCASRAGEVRGLKKSSAVPYSGIVKAPCIGVCAGETSGVNDTCCRWSEKI